MITKYKDVDNNDDIAHYFGGLLIDTNDCIPEFESFFHMLEQFHISIAQLKSSDLIIVVNILAYNVFKHQITLSDKTLYLLLFLPPTFSTY